MSDQKDERPKKEIERRMTEAVRRTLNMPPKPFTKPAKSKSTEKKKPAK